MLNVNTDLLAGPWHRGEHAQVIRVTSPEQPGHAFAMLYVKTGARAGKPCAKMKATANVMLAGPEMYRALQIAEAALVAAYGEPAGTSMEGAQGRIAINHARSAMAVAEGLV